MKRSGLVVLTAVLAALPGSRLWAQGPTPWIHIRVEEPRRESKVHVNLPLSVVQAVLAAAPEKVAHHGRVHILDHHSGLSVADLRRMWKALRETGETELVSVEEKDETVRVARKGDTVLVTVDAPKRKESVHVEVPVALLDALLSAEGEELDLSRAMDEIRKLRGDIVRVNDEDSTVRIWIDEKSGD